MASSSIQTDQIISHGLESEKSLEVLIDESKQRIETCKFNTALTTNQKLEWLHQLLEHEQGRKFFLNKGWDGQLTKYFIDGVDSPSDNDVIRFMKRDNALILSTRERFGIFKTQLQKYLNQGNIKKCASVPCGLMDDLLTLDVSNVSNFNFTGVDLDTNSLRLARESAKSKGLEKKCEFIHSSAWKLSSTLSLDEEEKGEDKKFDMLTSNGLNIYESNDDKVVDLYREFNYVLKVDGVLVTSALVHPPKLDYKDRNAINIEKSFVIFSTIVGVGWSNFRSETKTRDQLSTAGFKDIEFIYDSQGYFPTIVCRKC